MTTEPFVESGMTFGPYSEGTCFRIEISRVYQRIADHLKIAEFILLTKDVEERQWMRIAEAKASAPHPGGPRFVPYINEIRDKLANTLHLGLACCLSRHDDPDHEIPASFPEASLHNLKVSLYLVVKNDGNYGLTPFQDALRDELFVTVKAWNLGATVVAVLDEQGARRHGLMG